MTSASSVAPAKKGFLGLSRAVILRLEIAALILLTAGAVYFAFGGRRREQWLQKASLAQLQTEAKRDSSDPRTLYYLGRRLSQLGQAKEATTLFAQAATLEPDDEDFWLAWASASAQANNDREPFGILTLFSKKHPESVRAHLALALLYRQKEAYQRAFDEASVAARLDPKNTVALRLMGDAGIELEKYAEATDALNRAVYLEPEDARNYNLLGRALDGQNKYAEAIAAYRKTLILTPDDKGVGTALGRAQLKLATTDAALSEATATLEKAVTQNPSHVAALIELGRAYLRGKRIDKAKVVLQRAERLAPRSEDTLYNLKIAMEQSGNKAAAALYSQRHQEVLTARLEQLDAVRLLKQNPQDAGLRLKYARICARQGDLRTAADAYKRLLELKLDSEQERIARAELEALRRRDPNVATETPIRLFLPAAGDAARKMADILADAERLLELKRFPEAEQAFRIILARDENSAPALEGLGLSLSEQGKTEEAFQALNAAVKIDAKRPKAQYALAHIYYDSGFADDAKRRMREVTAMEPNRAEYWQALGLANVTTASPDDLIEAEKAYSRAATLEPGNANYLRDLANTEVRNKKWASAEGHYREALKISPDDPVTMQAFASFLSDYQPNSERLREAESLLIVALAKNPRTPMGQATLGNVYLIQGRIPEAIETLERALSASSGDATSWYRLARAYRKRGNKERAEYCLKAFRTINGYKTRLAEAEEAARMNLSDPDRRLKVARLYAESGQTARAINQYQMSLKLNPKNDAVRKEMDKYIADLKARGELPKMESFNGMVLASVGERVGQRSAEKSSPPAAPEKAH